MDNINILIDSQRRASAPHGAYTIADNNDHVITFDIDDDAGFTRGTKTAVFVTDRGKLPSVDFVGATVTLPRLLPEDGLTIYVGITQGEIKTTTPAIIRIDRSVYGYADGRVAPDPYDPPNYDELPEATQAALADLVVLYDVSEGKRVKASLEVIKAAMGAGDSHSPYIGENGHWFEYDDDEGDYVDTLVNAQGPQGATGAQGPQGETGAQGPKGDTGDSGSFTVTYDVTTWAQLTAAVAAGKTIDFTDGAGSYGIMDVYHNENGVGFAKFTVIHGEDYSTEWVELDSAEGWRELGGGAPVSSVNGQTGKVVLDADDVGAMPSAAIDSLIELLCKVAYIDDDGQQYIDDLEDALYNRTLSSISAVFTQGSATITPNTPLDDLKQYLVVTATYSDSTTRTVTDYTLSGTLAVGTSTITAAWKGKTDTFDVTVEENLVPSGYTAYDYIAMDISINEQTSGNTKGILVPDIALSSDYSYETELYYPSGSGDVASCFIGGRAGQTGAKNLGLFFTVSKNKLGYWISGTDTVTLITALRSDYVNKIKILPVGASQTYPNNVVISINGTEYNTGATSTGASLGSWLGFFKYAISATSLNSTTSYYRGEKIGRTTIKNGSTVVYDFIAANNGTYGGIYERVTGTFYTVQTLPEIGITGNWS